MEVSIREPNARPGVGVLFNPSMDLFVERSLHHLDYLAVTPDRAWIDKGIGSTNRFQPLPLAVTLLRKVADKLPIVLHSVGLSIGSADLFDEEYARNLITWAKDLDAPWISEHLSFTRVGRAQEVNSAIALPIPYDEELLDLLVPRIRFFTEAMGCPFLLENNAYYITYPDQTFSEEVFCNELCRRTGSKILLDLHNLYTNAVNQEFNPLEYLANLDLDNVREIHVAGGVPMMGFHTDSHTGPVLEEVWQLLDHTVPRTRNLQGVTFEFHESSFGLLGEEGILQQVNRAREIINNHVTSRVSASAS